jgi:hypothetical protein
MCVRLEAHLAPSLYRACSISEYVYVQNDHQGYYCMRRTILTVRHPTSARQQESSVACGVTAKRHYLKLLLLLSLQAVAYHVA